MTDKERITELEEEVLHLCNLLEMTGDKMASIPSVIARARLLATRTSDSKFQKSWQEEEEETIKICCDICDAEGLNSCRGSKGDDDEPAAEDVPEFDLDWKD